MFKVHRQARYQGYALHGTSENGKQDHDPDKIEGRRKWIRGEENDQGVTILIIELKGKVVMTLRS
jgi:hypothetical protein